MKIHIQAKPNAREERVDPPSPGGFGEARRDYFTVSVKEPPVKGMANQAIIRALAEYFHVPKQNIKIVSGHTSRRKIVERLR